MATLCGFPACAQGRSRFTWAVRDITLGVYCSHSQLNGGAVAFDLLAHRASKVCEGLHPRGIAHFVWTHHAIFQPSTTSWTLASSSPCLSGACYSPCRVVCTALLQGLIGYLVYPRLL